MFLFILVSCFFFLCSFKKVRKSQKKVSINLLLLFITSHKTATCAHDMISYVPAVILLTDAMFLHVLYYIVNFIICANIQLRQIDFYVFRMYFAIIQLVCHVNALVNRRL